MPKLSKKAKGQRPPKEGPSSLNQDSLAQLTSRIDKSLGGGDHKRKQPPTAASDKQQPKRQRASADAPPRDVHGAGNDQAALLAEIKALGGDESDLELINGVDSDDETYAQDSKKPIDKALKEELAALSKELGFAALVPEEASDVDEGPDAEEEEDGDDHVDEDDDEEDEDEDDADEQVAPRKPGGMTFEPLADWHSAGLRSLPGPTTDQLGSFMSAVESLKQYAKSLLEQDAAKYRGSVFASSSHKFLSTIMSSGTLTDKVSALTLAIQESPVHNIRAFDALMNLASKKSRAQAIGAIGALVDLLGPGTLLPSDRRLKTFQSQPGLLGALQRNSVKSWDPSQRLPGRVTEAHLIAWAYEDWLKATYFKIIQLLEVWCSDEIEYSRMKAVDFVYGLLKEKPEQESNLLTLLVNKLGDRDRKIASRASYLLLQLQVSHPGMKPIIIRSIEQDILLHPSQDTRSKYYAINTLNQTILSSKEPAVAESLVRIYFDIFVTLLKTGSLGIGAQGNLDHRKETKPQSGKPNGTHKGKPPAKQGKPGSGKPSVPETEAADKLVSAVLTGVNRAAPFVGANDAIMENHLNTLFTIAHSANFNTGIQALLLIQHLSSARNLATDRFYRTLYESLLDPRLVTSSKQSLYLNLLLRALKNDVDVRRVKAFAKRMLQITGMHQPPFVCGLLYVISHLRQTFPDLSMLVEDPETSVFDDDDAKDQPQYDGRKRNPEHSNAHRSCLWELIPVQTHFHPSVSVFAAALLDKTRKMPKPDMESHSLIRFLDKFVYRNPKSTDSARGASIMQPLRATKDLGDIWLGSKGAGATSAPVNSAAFWNKKAQDVAAEDVFFHEYFQHMGKEPKEPKEKAKKETSGEGDEENDEDEIWEALVSAQPDVGDDGSDAGFDDLDELDMASSDDEDDSPALSLDSDMEDDSEDMLEGSEDDEGAGSDGLVAAVEDEDEGDGEAKDEAKDKKKSRRKMLKSLPMFASVDDYAEMLAGEEDGL
ncbi:RNA-binding ribosome biosynthesis protein mak21 [Purpureocillium takamizusanense]|uniref:RNA-binding ribosome biosynthesis protein mak21 n=1 Tax=Purpureocillium takamizusanense TaxID=2060973 RepID=A0A9Q8Q921_9HYPO|nr:RNA-binding ribosome biosynthesis protein mak21 [Purpureocillium takamizusanense]UNI15235.1 RNA-binding ribosome biosynthesis protein mak21 [Purpureocillium takamizusanense]